MQGFVGMGKVVVVDGVSEGWGGLVGPEGVWNGGKLTLGMPSPHTGGCS